MPTVHRSKYTTHHHIQRGFTLIEVLAAVAIMTLLSVLGYRGLSFLITANERVGQHSKALLELDNAFSQVEYDLNYEVQHPQLRSEKKEAPDRWAITPIHGWIPSPVIETKTPPALEAYLKKTYIVRYESTQPTGVRRIIGCENPASFQPSEPPPELCQSWHGIRTYTSSVTFTSPNDTQERTANVQMKWDIQTPEGLISRQWAQ
jgi:prepilin-type N-terminal cleavage/methylation domain-containing protein